MTVINSRTTRQSYENNVAPRSLLKTFLQKRLHMFARSIIVTPLRVAVYRAMGASIGRDVFIGIDTWLDDQFPELITIEDLVTISFRVTIIVHDDARMPDGITAKRGLGTVAPVHLKRGCYIGAGAMILPGITIGEDSVVAAGSVVTRDVADGTVVAGVPARPLRTTSDLSSPKREAPI